MRIFAPLAGRVAGIAAVAAVGFLLWPAGVSSQGKAISDIYLDKCAVCHAADGSGKTAKGRQLKVEDVRKTIVKLTSEQMVEIVAKGKKPDMDAFSPEFSADQIKQLTEYYRGLAKK